MIRVASSTKVLMLKPDGVDEAAFKLDLAAAGGENAALIVECVRTDAEPICPSCMGGLDDQCIRAGAGLVVCPTCGHPLVALRFVGGRRGVEWYSFPWPK